MDPYTLLRPLLFGLEAETAHDVSLRALRGAERARLLPAVLGRRRPAPPVRLMGLTFPNRIGLAAGLDKAGDSIDALGRLGFGFIEVGTITPRPQAGNPRPRLFRLPEHEALINRMGFNNPGIETGVANVGTAREFRAAAGGVIGFNIGKNKDTPNEQAGDDYLTCLRAAYPVADYVTVNLSSPNTPGLRDLQGEEASARLLEALKTEQASLATRHGKQVPVLFKVAPDLDEAHIRGLARVFRDGGLDGLIATNTTIERDGVHGHALAGEAGGLSGRPLRQRSESVLAAFAAELGAAIPIIGVGGISSAEDAIARLRAGASLVQVYTALIYQGPQLVRRLVRATSALPGA